MSLTPGTRLGPYEIVSPLGAGGMGEVFRARDTKLNRDVAIKVLPESFALDADRVARFTREAQVLASLNHPNIAAIYGIEEQGSTRALVMELVDGEDLSAHIARGPIALSEALPIARQIADALEAAHEQGIVHRDLKPANIKVRADGTVKVLDFGLAKALDAHASSATADAMNSPTLTTPAMTQAGMILGTAAYMAPEQARGKVIDRRADIWAFGAVLFEMLTGRRAFEGEDISVTLANVIKEDPKWDALPKDLPSPMLRLLRRCLEKDPRRRLSAIADARLELDEAGAPSDGASPGAARAGISRRERWIWASVAGLAAVTALAFALRSAPARDVAAPVIRFGLEVGATLDVPRMAISPDGQSLVFGETRPDGSSSLLVRRLDSIDSTPVAGSETAILPFWSPDSRQVAFFADSPKDPALTELRITDLQGGGPRTIVSLPPSDAAGSWNADGLVLVASRGTKGIQRTSLNGGQLTPVTTLDPSGGEIAHLYPQFLPDGRHFIYQAATSARENWAIFIGSIDSPVRRKLVQSDYAQFAAPNLLVYTQRENLVAQTMDLSTLALTGQPAVIATGIASLPVNGRAAFSVSDTGVLVYKSRPEPQAPIERHLTWLDRSGKVLNVVGPPVTSSVVRLSPDGTRAALLEVPTSLWVADLARDVKAPVLRTQASSPTWSADGTRLLFGVTTLTFDNQSALFERDAGGATPMKTLPAGKGFPRLLPFDETSDGTLVLFGRAGGSGHRGIGMLSTADGKVTTYLDNNVTGSQAALSPDRRFLAYTSTETNPSEVIVQTFPDPSGGKWIVSVRGGSAPRWRRDGRELFYVDAEQRLVSVPVTAGSSFVPGRATPLFSLPVSIQTDSSGAYGYDAAADGQRFLVSLPPDSASAKAPTIPLTVITNWTMLLKKGAR